MSWLKKEMKAALLLEIELVMGSAPLPQHHSISFFNKELHCSCFARPSFQWREKKRLVVFGLLMKWIVEEVRVNGIEPGQQPITHRGAIWRVKLFNGAAGEKQTIHSTSFNKNKSSLHSLLFFFHSVKLALLKGIKIYYNSNLRLFHFEKQTIYFSLGEKKWVGLMKWNGLSAAQSTKVKFISICSLEWADWLNFLCWRAMAPHAESNQSIPFH